MTKIFQYYEGSENNYILHGGNKKNIYSIVDFPEIGKTYGNYISSRPSLAASKALTKMTKLANISNTSENNFIIFTIKNNNNNKKI